jgi:hypothetical protein
MPENKEVNKSKLPLHNQNHVSFGLKPRQARLIHLLTLDKGETHVILS